ncbi:MAG: hypothetical protein WDO68_09745 [Gammaproteobacteria bacterium]
MTRLFTALCVAGAVLTSAPAIAQTSVGNGSKSVGAEPAPPRMAGAPPVDGEVPAALLDKIRAELASEQGVSAGDVKVISARSVNWPNGALGCPKPGTMYTQAIVPGYRIELEAGGKRFGYNASARGGFKRCDGLRSLTPRSAK